MVAKREMRSSNFLTAMVFGAHLLPYSWLYKSKV
ncbi:DUF7010 family protein [Fannyhessea vaginae]